MSKLELSIPDQMITDAVRAQIASSISEQGAQEMVEHVVKLALEERHERSYGRQTIFQKAVNTMIQEEAERIFGEWLDENRELLKETLLRELNGRRQKRLKDIAEEICSNMGRFSCSVSFSLPGRE